MLVGFPSQKAIEHIKIKIMGGEGVLAFGHAEKTHVVFQVETCQALSSKTCHLAALE